MAIDKSSLSVVQCWSSNVDGLEIADRRILFIKDKKQIALDSNGIRTFYNQFVILDTESQRVALNNPTQESIYFVAETQNLWVYSVLHGWKVVLSPFDSARVIINDTAPETGEDGVLYANKADKTISIWDSNNHKHEVVADYTNEALDTDISGMFT